MNTPELKMQFPFRWFYNSIWEDPIDSQMEREATHLVETDNRFKEMDIEEVQNALQDSVKWKDACTTIAKEYVRSYGTWLQSELGLSDADFGWQFDALERPREYNFETDRVFVKVSENVVHLLFEQTNEAILREVIYETFKERSGFIPFYSNDADVWLETPVEDWDHNELGTLLRAWLETLWDNDADREFWKFDHEMYEMIANAIEVDADAAYEALTVDID